MERVNTGSNWCCWPFSICCGNIDTPESEPLNRGKKYVASVPPSEPMSINGAQSIENKSDGVRTPGTTPTKSHIVQEQRMEEQPDYV